MTVVTEPDTAIQAEQEGAAHAPYPFTTPERMAAWLALLEEASARRGLVSRRRFVSV